MSNFSKIVILILIVLSFFFINEKFGDKISSVFSSIKGIQGFEIPKKNEQIKTPTDIIKQNENNQDKETVCVYFLALDSNDNGIYKKVQRELPEQENKLKFAIEELLKGPNIAERASGAYTEIPKNTKLINIKEEGNRIIIDLSSDFQYGGGTDSIYSRMMQIIKTAVINTDNKKIYLYLDGKEVNFIGGEGIMITQPLTEKSLEV